MAAEFEDSRLSSADTAVDDTVAAWGRLIRHCLEFLLGFRLLIAYLSSTGGILSHSRRYKQTEPGSRLTEQSGLR